MKEFEQIRSGSAKLAKLTEYLTSRRRLESGFRTWRTVLCEDLVLDFEQAARNQVITETFYTTKS